MKKSISLFLTLAILLVTLLPTFSAAANNSADEITALRNSIKSVYDIDADMYNKLEAAVLEKYRDVTKDAWYMSVMVKLVGLSALDGSLDNRMDPTGTVTKARAAQPSWEGSTGEEHR